MTDAIPALKKVREKFPGAYDDLDDAALLGKLKAKYPDYADLELPSSVPSLAPPPPVPKSTLDLTWKDFGVEPPPGPYEALGSEIVGAGKSALNTAYQAARLPFAAMARPWSRASGKEPPPLISKTPEALRPTDDAQVIGTAFERIAETLVAPELWGARLPLIVQAIGNMAGQAGINWLQGGTKEEIALAAALGAVPPATSVATNWIRNWKPAVVAKLVDRIGKALPSLGATLGHTMGGYVAGEVGREIGRRVAVSSLSGTSRLPGAAGYTASWLKPPRLPGVSAGDAARILPSLAQPEMQMPGGEQQNLPSGKVVIRRPGQKPEIVDVEVDAEGRVRLKR